MTVAFERAGVGCDTRDLVAGSGTGLSGSAGTVEKSPPCVAIGPAEVAPDPRERLLVIAGDVRRHHEAGAAVPMPGDLCELSDGAAAVVRALASAGVHRELVVSSGWTPQMYERWLGEALADALL